MMGAGLYLGLGVLVGSAATFWFMGTVLDDEIKRGYLVPRKHSHLWGTYVKVSKRGKIDGNTRKRQQPKG